MTGRRGGEEWTQDVKRFRGIDPEVWKASLVDQMMKKYIKGEAAVLEVGVGAGRWSAILQELAARLILTDISQKCLDLCRERFKQVDQIEYYFIKERLNGIADNSIDAVWSCDVFVHLNPTDIERSLEDFSRILKPGGIVMIHHPGSLPSGERLSKGFRSYMDRDLFAHLVAKQGMVMIEQNDTLTHMTDDVISVFQSPMEKG